VGIEPPRPIRVEMNARLHRHPDLGWDGECAQHLASRRSSATSCRGLDWNSLGSPERNPPPAVVGDLGTVENLTMSKEGIEGATQKGVGAMKEGAGKLTGNKKLEAEGLADKAVGTAKEGFGKAKDAIHKATK